MEVLLDVGRQRTNLGNLSVLALQIKPRTRSLAFPFCQGFVAAAGAISASERGLNVMM